MITTLLISILTFLQPLSDSGWQRTYKVLHKYYGEEVLLSKNHRVLPSGNLYSIDGKQDYVYIGKAKSKFEDFDYMVILHKKTIKYIKILVYRENYGGEVCSRRYLERNYIGRDTPKPFVDAISGATISVKSLNYSINTLIKSL